MREPIAALEGDPVSDALRSARVAAIIAAHNEAATIADVVCVAAASERVDEVIVVDNLSTDSTGSLAADAGARVVEATTLGKGEAMSTGVAATDANVLLFLDGDLLGLRAEHVDRLVKAVTEDGAAMSCGLFDRGPFLNPIFLRFLPVLTGERAVGRDLFEALDPDDIEGYKIEAALNSRCGELSLKRISFVCNGLWHLTKEKKYGNPLEGFVRKLLMLGTAIWSYLAYRLRRRRRVKARELARAKRNA